MELLTAADDGEVVVYECPDCGCQVENRVEDEGAGDDQNAPELPPGDEDTLEAFDPEDPS
jgi:hypothetical protein